MGHYLLLVAWKHVLIPKYGQKMPLLLRYKDDLIGVAIFGGSGGLIINEWNEFKLDMNDFGILKWDIEESLKQIEYLDLNIGIESRMFTFKTYQKPINLYQYITPNSAHPPGMIQGVVHSQLLQYFKQNSRREDYWKIAMSFY